MTEKQCSLKDFEKILARRCGPCREGVRKQYCLKKLGWQDLVAYISLTLPVEASVLGDQRFGTSTGAVRG